MSEAKQNVLVSAHYLNSTDGKRVIAVSAALEVIAAKASSSAPLNLEAEFENLSKYADQIQAAIDKK